MKVYNIKNCPGIVAVVLLANCILAAPVLGTCLGSGNHTSDLVVSTNQTLTICSGATLAFAEGKRLIVQYNGTLVADGVTLTAMDTSKGWLGIKLEQPNPDTFINDSIIEYVKRPSNGSGAYFIYLKDSSPVITYNIIRNPVPTSVYGSYVYPSGIFVEGSIAQPYVQYNQIDSRGNGILFTDYASPYIRLHRNGVSATTASAVYAAFNAYINMSYIAGGDPMNDICGGVYTLQAYYDGEINANDGLNSFRASTETQYLLWVDEGGIIDARGNAIYPYPTTKFNGGGTIYEGSYTLGSQCTAAKNSSVSVGDSTGGVVQELTVADSLLYLARRQVDNGFPGDASEILREVILSYPEEHAATRAVNQLARLEETSIAFDRLSFLEGLTHGVLRRAALGALIHVSRVGKDTDAARGAAERLIASATSAAEEYYGMYVLAKLYLREARLDLAEAVFGEMTPSTDAEELVYQALTMNLADARSRIGGEGDETGVPDIQVYPNPFNPSATLDFKLPERSDVKITVFDILGREVAVLLDGHLLPGSHSATFDAEELPSGMYLYSIAIDGAVSTGKMMLVK